MDFRQYVRDPPAAAGDLARAGDRRRALGAAIGLAGAAAGSRLLENQLFRVAPTDPATFVSGAVLLLGVSAVACAIPARRALRLDPIKALRN